MTKKRADDFFIDQESIDRRKSRVKDGLKPGDFVVKYRGWWRSVGEVCEDEEYTDFLKTGGYGKYGGLFVYRGNGNVVDADYLLGGKYKDLPPVEVHDFREKFTLKKEHAYMMFCFVLGMAFEMIVLSL